MFFKRRGTVDAAEIERRAAACLKIYGDLLLENGFREKGETVYHETLSQKEADKLAESLWNQAMAQSGHTDQLR